MSALTAFPRPIRLDGTQHYRVSLTSDGASRGRPLDVPPNHFSLDGVLAAISVSASAIPRVKGCPVDHEHRTDHPFVWSRVGSALGPERSSPRQFEIRGQGLCFPETWERCPLPLERRSRLRSWPRCVGCGVKDSAKHTADRPETLREAQEWDASNRHYVHLGLCYADAGQAAFGHQMGFTRVNQPCLECRPIIAGFPDKAANGWRSHSLRKTRAGAYGTHAEREVYERTQERRACVPRATPDAF